MKAPGGKTGQDDVRVFKPSPGTRLAGILVAGLVIAILPGICAMMSASTPQMFFYTSMLVVYAFMIPLLFVLGLFVYFSFTGMRLVIAPDRIEYYTVGYSIASDWNNVARVDQMPGAFGKALFLRQPATKLSGWLSTFFALSP